MRWRLFTTKVVGIFFNGIVIIDTTYFEEIWITWTKNQKGYFFPYLGTLKIR